VKLLVFADLHLKHGSPYDREPGDRLEDQVRVGQRIVEIARERGCGLIGNCGDTYHGPTVVPEEYDAYTRIFGDCEIPVYSIRGNGSHDLSKRTISAPAVVERSRYFTHPDLVVVEGVALAFLPGQAVDRLVAAKGGGDRAVINQEASMHLISIAQDLRRQCAEKFPDLPAILLGHWCVEGAAGWEFMQQSEPVLPLADLEALRFDAALFGHIHEHSVLSEDPYIASVGSPMPQNFGEAGGDHGVLVLELAA